MSSKPSSPPTHTPVDLARLMKLSGEIEDRADGEEHISAESLDELASDLGVDRALLYAALPLGDVELEHAAADSPRFTVCVGGCQGWGALPCLESLLDARDQRAGRFEVAVRDCLDRCRDAAVVTLSSPNGDAVIGQATPAALAEAIETLDDLG